MRRDRKVYVAINIGKLRVYVIQVMFLLKNHNAKIKSMCLTKTQKNLLRECIEAILTNTASQLKHHLSHSISFFFLIGIYYVISCDACRRKSELTQIVYAGSDDRHRRKRIARSRRVRGVDSSFAGVMVHTAHSRRLEKRKPRAKCQQERRRRREKRRR